MTAYHEAGHALVARMLAHADPVRKVSIVARGMMGGYTRVVPDEDRLFKTKAQFEDELAVYMAGHVAEDMVFEEQSTGAANDIERATGLARRMVTEFGMSRTLGPRPSARKTSSSSSGGRSTSSEITATRWRTRSTRRSRS